MAESGAEGSNAGSAGLRDATLLRLLEQALEHEPATREAWLAQVRFVVDQGIEIRRVDHGMTHSAYISDPDGHRVELLYVLPRDVWADDIDGALNDYQLRPADELVDRTDYRTIHDRATSPPSEGRG